MFEHFRPLGDKVLIKRCDFEEKTSSVIIAPDGAKEKAQTGEVIAVGPGRIGTTGAIQPMQVKTGDIVYVSKYAGTEIDADKNHLIVREEDILGIVTK